MIPAKAAVANFYVPGVAQGDVVTAAQAARLIGMRKRKEREKEKMKIGLALAGGGGLGAYQIGVWKALHETGLDQYITSVAGTSVGGLNAALFAQGDYKKAELIWRHISPGQILSPKDSGQKGGIFGREGLEKIIEENLDMRCFDENNDRNLSCWLTLFRTDREGREQGEYTEAAEQVFPSGDRPVARSVAGPTEYIDLRHVRAAGQPERDEKRKQYLLATSAMRWIFSEIEIDGRRYRDGAGGDNIPIRPLVEVDDCDIVLVVYLRDTPIDRGPYRDRGIFEIFPSEGQHFPGILNFEAGHARGLMELGYRDAIGRFRGIKGKIGGTREELREYAETCLKGMSLRQESRKLDQKISERMEKLKKGMRNQDER